MLGIKYVREGEAFMLVHANRVSPANTVKKNNKSFRGSVVLRTLKHSRSDQIKRIVSQLQRY
jgi:hypothetical protein